MCGMWVFSGKKWFNLFWVVLILIFLASCEKVPVFNFIGQKEYSSEDFVVGPPLVLDQIKRVGSVYDIPGAGVGGTSHNGIHIGADEGMPFIAGVLGIIVAIVEGQDYYTRNKHVELEYNSEFSIVYLFEPDKKIVVSLGQSLEKGETIGYLGERELGYIDQCVHFGVKRNGNWVCPVPYLEEGVRNKLNQVYQTTPKGSDAPKNICNCPEHEHYF
jgi:murein DD-endopeptidase MepM/ murein hydrolase activator NlpD